MRALYPLAMAAILAPLIALTLQASAGPQAQEKEIGIIYRWLYGAIQAFRCEPTDAVFPERIIVTYGEMSRVYLPASEEWQGPPNVQLPMPAAPR